MNKKRNRFEKEIPKKKSIEEINLPNPLPLPDSDILKNAPPKEEEEEEKQLVEDKRQLEEYKRQLVEDEI